MYFPGMSRDYIHVSPLDSNRNKKFVLLQFQNYSYRDLKFVCRVADEPTKDQYIILRLSKFILINYNKIYKNQYNMYPDFVFL